jgi:transposase
MADAPPGDPKVVALRKQGSLHPHPDAVTAELFAESDFFDARDLVQVKYEMIRRVHQDGSSVTEAAGAFGLSRPSYYAAEAAFRTGGLPGLVPLKRGPRHPHKLTAEVMDFLRAARQEEAVPSPRELAERVRERFGISVHPRTVERGLHRTGEKP